MKSSKIIVFLSAIIFATLMSLLTIVVKADSGWDSDYDSGWSSDSSWDSDWGGSSWDSDWDSSSSYYSSSRSGAPLTAGRIIFLIFIFVVLPLILENIKANKETFNRSFPSITKHVLEEEIQKVLPDFSKKEFIDKAYDMFINVQNAWMDFDYDTLRNYLSDELYNTYKSQLKALDAQKQKNIMSDFDRYDIDISEFEYNDNKLTIKVELIVSFYDYVINNKNQIVRGTDRKKITNHYELTYISSISKKNRPNKCPNCGAPLGKVASMTCPYCNSTISSNNYDWVLSKKQIKR